MILDDIKAYLIAHPHCTQASLALAFSLSDDGVEAMLSVWRKKGRVKTTVSKEKDRQTRRYLWIKDNEIGLTVIMKSF